MGILDFRRNISVALSGGGARGWAHIGVIKALKKLNYKITAISGTSAGAIVASYEAFGMLDSLEEYILNSDKKKVFSFFDFNFIPKYGLINGKKVTDMFNEKLNGKLLENSNIPLYICATNLQSGKCTIFKRGLVVDAVRASISIPGIFTPVEINGRYYVDGGLANPLPVNALTKNGHKRVIAVDVNVPLQAPVYKEMPNVLTVINRSIGIMTYYVDKYNLKKYKPWKILTPNLKDFGTFEFHRGKELIDIGYEYAMNFFKG
ncbi:MAG: patatin-like phospholipase family protein [Deferribacterales bacterium]|nr:patatin-like phospholipase family protein [Deferribacterales bacterium]